MSMVFISHSSSDDAFVSRLAADLKRAGVESWVDHEDIQPGDEWDHEIEAALKACAVLIFVATTASLTSEVCRDEWNDAVGRGKIVIPILRAGHLSHDDLPLRLRRKQMVDFRGNYDRALKTLLEALGVLKKTTPLPPLPVPFVEDDPTVVAVRLPALDWIEIPAGEVTIQGANQHTMRQFVDAFSISKYPITVMQYEYFIKADGYHQKDLWSQTGWEWRSKNVITLPQFWKKDPWHVGDHPVVGVSWYEAMAFCNWLTRQLTGAVGARHAAPLRITLPSEQQWQRAAQGDDGRLYPWGDDFDPTRCNTDESGIGKTTPVNRYADGVSPYTVYDLCGNAWEWCGNIWNSRSPGDLEGEGTHKRVMRGGSWRLDRKTATCVSRHFTQPEDRFSFIGFRLVLSGTADLL